MKPRAFLVCVDYADLLAITLPRNRHHFEEVNIVTTLTDSDTRRVAQENDARIYVTHAFYEDGAQFNKWKALEEGLDHFGRDGIICLMDADVLWPRNLPGFEIAKGKLYTPLRHMYNPVRLPIPSEENWFRLPIHRNVAEWAGYSQIFHGDDPHLPQTPWHETNWKHAGGADSFFQQWWPRPDKVRPPFHVLHLGAAGENWMGRATPYTNGAIPAKAGELKKQLHNMWLRRRRSRSFDAEKIAE